MSLKVKKHWAERFMDWYPYNTKLYIRGERGKDWPEMRKLHKELFDQLVVFLDAMTKYRKILGHKSLVIIISDFLLDPEEVKEGLLRLGNHDVKLVQVLDPSEKELQISGDVKLTDAETHTELRTYISPRLISQYEYQLDSHVAKLNKTALDIKADFFFVTTDTPVFDVFYKILS